MVDGSDIGGPLGVLRLGALVLAAGGGRRFGGHKLAAELDGRPLLQHVLDTLDAVRPAVTVVVLGSDTSGLERIDWHGERRVVNQDPGRGLSSSIQLGVAVCADGEQLDGVFILLGDQPRTTAATLIVLSHAAPEAIAEGALAVLPDYATGGGANPALLLRAGFPLVGQLSGDRGLGTLFAARPGQVKKVAVPGSNPDVDTVADLEALRAEP